MATTDHRVLLLGSGISVPFLLIGLEVFVLRFQVSGLMLAACAVPFVLVARPIAVSAPVL